MLKTLLLSTLALANPHMSAQKPLHKVVVKVEYFHEDVVKTTDFVEDIDAISVRECMVEAYGRVEEILRNLEMFNNPNVLPPIVVGVGVICVPLN